MQDIKTRKDSNPAPVHKVHRRRPGRGQASNKTVRINMYFDADTAEALEEVKRFIANLGPESFNYKTGETGKPLPSNPLIIDRMLVVYKWFLRKLTEGKPMEEAGPALQREYQNVYDKTQMGAKMVVEDDL
jgi:hypothetical protein